MAETEILPAPEIKLPAPIRSPKWEREKRAFRRLRPDVAIHNEQVVGSGPDQFELARESYRRFGYVPIYVGLVTDEPTRPVRIRTPRIIGR